MSAPLLIDVPSLAAHGAGFIVLDCRAHLTDAEQARQAFRAGHIPAAVHVELERDLSDMSRQGEGRHPLPNAADIALRFARLGVRLDRTVVLYDADGGAFAARAWWMLRLIGHPDVRLLDGGLAAWQASGQPLETGAVVPKPITSNAPGALEVRRSQAEIEAQLCGLNEVQRNLDTRTSLVLDARTPERYRGENETLDPRGGHIPGARNRFFRDNLDAQGRFKPAAQLREEFALVLGDYAPAQVISQCGSGVTACHNLFAMQLAGLPGARLYAGSWSQWCADPLRPIATGAAA